MLDSCVKKVTNYLAIVFASDPPCVYGVVGLFNRCFHATTTVCADLCPANCLLA